MIDCAAMIQPARFHHAVTLRPWRTLPPPETADENGLVAFGGDFAPATLLDAYRHGMFPWSVDPITWWSPDPRAVFEIATFHVPRRLERTIRAGRFAVTFDTAFTEVMHACSLPGPGREDTWIAPAFITAYTRLHRLGHAHSVETWLDGRLVGGAYGVTVGGLYAGESMFHLVPDAGKVALATLMRHLAARGYTLFDSQVINDATAALGAREISRTEYLQRLKQAVELPVVFA